MDKSRELKSRLTRTILDIQVDCERCIKGIRRMNISSKEKKKKIDEIAEMVHAAMLSREDFIQLSSIKKELEKAYDGYNKKTNNFTNSDRIEML